jgi:hypothetical protein
MLRILTHIYIYIPLLGDILNRPVVGGELTAMITLAVDD